MVLESASFSESRYAETHRFSDILASWRLARGENGKPISIEKGAQILRISSRNLRKLVDGVHVPHDSTMFLIEAEVATGAGVTVNQLRSVVAREREVNHGRGLCSDADVMEAETATNGTIDGDA